MNTEGYRFSAEGTVKGPDAMIDAARKSLSPHGFDRLMLQTGGQPPSAAELCAFADAERAAACAPLTSSD